MFCLLLFLGSFLRLAPSTNNSAVSRELFRVRFSSSPEVYVISRGLCVTASSGMDVWLDSLGLHTIKLITVFQGEEYRVGDFIVRIGTVRIGNKIQNSVVVEVRRL